MDNITFRSSSFSHRLTTGAAGLVLVLAAILIATCTYNIFFHPLRNLPGPPLARVSKLWSRIGNFYGCKSQRIHEAHMKYGPAVRVGPNEISFADPKAVREIYTSDNFVKEESFYRAKRIFHEEMMMSFRDPVAHKKRRKLLARGFSQAAMNEYEPEMTSKIETMMNQWASRSKDGPIDAFAWSHWLGFDIVYHLMFDQDPGSVTGGHPPKLMPYIRAWKPTFIYKELVPQLEQWGPYVPGYVGGYFRKVQEWKELAVGIIQESRRRGTKTPFLRSVFQGDKDEFLGRELTDSELAEECMGGMFGGSGTTANTFVYLLWACLQKPEVTRKLKHELVETFSSPNQVPEYSACQSLPYLQAVINETLRLYPTIIATLPRTAKAATVVAGVPVPAGTIVGTQNLTIHQDPAAFPDPSEFKPERWLEKDADESMKEAWIPFSLGTRKCVGINLAQMELSKVVAAFFLRFEAEIDPSMTEESMRMYDNFSAAPAGGRLLLHLRETTSKTKP